MKINKIKINTPLLIMILISILGISVYLLFFYVIKNKNEKASILAGEIDTLSKKQEKIISSKKLLASMSEDREIIDSVFVKQDSAVSFIEKLESLGKASGVDTSFSTVDVDPKQKNLLRVTMKTSGSFVNIYHFLSMVESLPYEIEVKRFYISKVVDTSKGKTPKNIWQGEISVELYSYISNK